MNKKALIPAGGILIIVCFFLPWIRACNVDITGAQLATDRDIGDASLWLVPLAGLIMLISYLAVRERARIFAVISSIASLILLTIKILGPISKGEAREMGMSLQIGGLGTIVGLVLALIGGFTAEYRTPAEDKGPPAPPGPLGTDSKAPPAPPEEAPKTPADPIKSAPAQTQPLDLSPSTPRKPRKWAKKLLWAVPAILLIGAGIFFAWPRPYQKHYRQAQSLYEKGQYREALSAIGQARVHNSTPELESLASLVQTKIDEQRARERQTRLKAEYDDWYGRALTALAAGDYSLARGYAVEAQKRIPTRDVRSVMAQIRQGAARQRAEQLEQARQAPQETAPAPAEDPDFLAAERAGTVSGYYEYLRAHPDGPSAALARARLDQLRQGAVQGPGGGANSISFSNPLSSSGDPRPATNVEMKRLLRLALARLAERQTESAPQQLGAATIEISGERNREKQQWMDQTLNAIDAGLGHLGEARRVSVQIADQYATTLIDNWIALTQKARTQLVSKKLLSNKHSFENQRQVVQEIRNFLR